MLGEELGPPGKEIFLFQKRDLQPYSDRPIVGGWDYTLASFFQMVILYVHVLGPLYIF